MCLNLSTSKRWPKDAANSNGSRKLPVPSMSRCGRRVSVSWPSLWKGGIRRIRGVRMMLSSGEKSMLSSIVQAVCPAQPLADILENSIRQSAMRASSGKLRRSKLRAYFARLLSRPEWSYRRNRVYSLLLKQRSDPRQMARPLKGPKNSSSWAARSSYAVKTKRAAS